MPIEGNRVSRTIKRNLERQFNQEKIGKIAFGQRRLRKPGPRNVIVLDDSLEPWNSAEDELARQERDNRRQDAGYREFNQRSGGKRVQCEGHGDQQRRMEKVRRKGVSRHELCKLTLHVELVPEQNQHT